MQYRDARRDTDEQPLRICMKANRSPLNVRKRAPRGRSNASNDRRVERSRRLLREALRELIQEKRFDEITVQNVLDRAGVARSTFYAHFRCVEDLFRSDFERFLEHFAPTGAQSDRRSPRLFPVRELFEHVRDFRAFCRGLVASGKMEALERGIASRFAARFERDLAARMSPPQRQGLPPAVLANHLGDTLVAMFDRWVRDDMPQTPTRMDELFHALVLPTVVSASRPARRVENEMNDE